MITSKTNKTVKLIASLKQKKYRDETGLYYAEGFKMVAEAKAAGKKIELIAATEEGAKKAGIRETDEHAVILSDDVFAYVSDETTPQGILALIREDDAAEELPEKPCVLLDGVSDPGNVGTILRTCVAAGAEDVFLVNCADPYSPKAVRASMSGIFFAKLRRKTKEETLKLLAGIPMIVADMKGENVFSFRPPEKFCLVIGNEANGVSDEVRAAAAYTVKIPMSAHSESLNAGVSLAVMLYELTAGKGLPLTGGAE